MNTLVYGYIFYILYFVKLSIQTNINVHVGISALEDIHVLLYCGTLILYFWAQNII